LLPRPRGTHFSLLLRATWLVSILLLTYVIETRAEKRRGSVVCRDEVSSKHRDALAAKLQKITGWSDLAFDRNGALRVGSKQAVGGSKAARELVTEAIDGSNAIVLEEANKRSDVVFCRVVPGRWKHQSSESPPVYVVLIDFADFEYVIGDDRALSAFDVGWAMLHVLDHIVNDSGDPASAGETGECEAHINQMRRECNLPERTDYFYTYFPLTADSTFVAKFVRLAFVEEDAVLNKKRHYWLLWDANRVGGLDEQKQIATLR
jgi:hypothetical protein